jgi:hypothetical protein
LKEFRVIPLEDPVEGQALVYGHTEDLSQHVLPGAPLLPFIKTEADGTAMHGLLGVGFIVNGKGIGKPEETAVSAEHLVRKGMERPALDTLTAGVVPCRAGYHLFSAASREG